ncbi:MAG: hypothetical protein WBW69_24015 [Candidatus Korobacteraceae bacterium]
MVVDISGDDSGELFRAHFLGRIPLSLFRFSRPRRSGCLRSLQCACAPLFGAHPLRACFTADPAEGGQGLRNEARFSRLGHVPLWSFPGHDGNHNPCATVNQWIINYNSHISIDGEMTGEYKEKRAAPVLVTPTRR